MDPVHCLPYRTAHWSVSHSPPPVLTPLLGRHTHTHTHMHRWNGVHLKKLTVTQLVNKLPTFHGTQRFMTTFTRSDICADTKSMNSIHTLPIYSSKIYFNINITEQGSYYGSFTSIGNLNASEFKGLFHRRVSKCQPPHSKQTSRLLKMLLNTWCSSYLEVLPIALQILPFTSCKGCGLLTQFFLLVSRQIIIA
jgi:hypothetical protein